jgi:hypothetical protein
LDVPPGPMRTTRPDRSSTRREASPRSAISVRRAGLWFVSHFDLALLKDHASLKQQPDKIFRRAQRLNPEVDVKAAKIERDVEHDCDAIVFQTHVAGALRETRLDFNYLSGAEWRMLCILGADLAEAGWPQADEEKEHPPPRATFVVHGHDGEAKEATGATAAAA